MLLWKNKTLRKYTPEHELAIIRVGQLQRTHLAIYNAETPNCVCSTSITRSHSNSLFYLFIFCTAFFNFELWDTKSAAQLLKVPVKSYTVNTQAQIVFLSVSFAYWCKAFLSPCMTRDGCLFSFLLISIMCIIWFEKCKYMWWNLRPSYSFIVLECVPWDLLANKAMLIALCHCWEGWCRWHGKAP